MSARSILKLESYYSEVGNPKFRTIFKTNHGRVVYLELERQDDMFRISDCFYIDRARNVNVINRPKKLKTVHFPSDDLITVLENELDKQFYGVEYSESEVGTYSTEAYIRRWKDANSKYRFLIMVGSGEIQNGLPRVLTTRFKNTLHRAVYLKLEYYKDGLGVVKECHYYDRKYRTDKQVTPPMLLSCFFPYTEDGIISLINQELCGNFTHIIVTENKFDIENNTTPLCGSI